MCVGARVLWYNRADVDGGASGSRTPHSTERSAVPHKFGKNVVGVQVVGVVPVDAVRRNDALEVVLSG